MKKTLIFLFMCLPMMSMAQSTLTPEQKLEQAQRQLEQAKAALEEAKANAAKAEAEARARKAAEAKDIEKKIAEAKAETERLKHEAAAINEAAGKLQTATAAAPAGTDTKKDHADRKNAADTWSVPAAPAAVPRTAQTPGKDSKENKELYLQKNAVPEINGQVIWTEQVEVPGATADELYDKAYAYLTELTQGSNQLEGSKVALVNRHEHSIVATVHEKLIFSSSFLSLDYTRFNYVLQATCRDGQAMLTMSRLTYNYDVQGNISNFAAETWITDKYAVNKKQTRLLPVSGKFRRATVDRKNSIFEGFGQALK